VHERALMRDVVARVLAVASAERATRVTAIGVRLGALSHFTPEHFREHFADAARETAAAGARVDAVLAADPADRHAADVLLERVEVELAGEP
jgi:hydrogenase nickel incorporation protein HypA/HybF